MFPLLMFLLHVRASFPLPPSPWVLHAGVIEVSSDQFSSGRNSLHRQKTVPTCNLLSFAFPGTGLSICPFEDPYPPT